MTVRDISRKDLMEALNNASKNAIARAKKHNSSITYLKGKTIVQVNPDGSESIIEELEQKLATIKSKIYTLNS